MSPSSSAAPGSPPTNKIAQPEEAGDGFIDSTLTKIFGHSYRTTIAGLASMTCGVVVAVGMASPGMIPQNIVAIAAALTPIIGGAGLVIAKDSRVTGGTRSANKSTNTPTSPEGGGAE